MKSSKICAGLREWSKRTSPSVHNSKGVAEGETKDVTRFGTITTSMIQPISGVEQTLTCLAVDI